MAGATEEISVGTETTGNAAYSSTVTMPEMGVGTDADHAEIALATFCCGTGGFAIMIAALAGGIGSSEDTDYAIVASVIK